MRTIIAGSRTATSHSDLLAAIAAITWKPTEVISGSARGADVLGEQWARGKQYPAASHARGLGYVHPESLPLLEPQIDDIYPYRDAKGFLHLHQVHDVYDLNCERGKVLTPQDNYSGITPERIIQRNGFAYMWPESEDT